MALVQLEKIKKIFRTFLQSKSYWSITLFSLITVFLCLLLFNSNLEMPQKIVFLLIYVIYFLLYLSKKTQGVVFCLLSIIFSIIVISYTGLDVNNIVYNSISVYFSIMMFNYFALRIILENFYKGKINKNIINSLVTLVLAILVVVLVNKRIIVTSTQILYLILCITILIEIVRRVFVFIKKKKSSIKHQN